MHSKTKIVVLHMKELIYTGIFVLLGILFIVLLVMMFVPDKKQTQETTTTSYIPGVYTTSLALGQNSLEIEIVLDAEHINSIRLVNLSEAVTLIRSSVRSMPGSHLTRSPFPMKTGIRAAFFSVRSHRPCKKLCPQPMNSRKADIPASTVPPASRARSLRMHPMAFADLPGVIPQHYRPSGHPADRNV